MSTLEGVLITRFREAYASTLTEAAGDALRRGPPGSAYSTDRLDVVIQPLTDVAAVIQHRGGVAGSDARPLGRLEQR